MLRVKSKRQQRRLCADARGLSAGAATTAVARSPPCLPSLTRAAPHTNDSSAVTRSRPIKPSRASSAPSDSPCATADFSQPVQPSTAQPAAAALTAAAGGATGALAVAVIMPPRLLVVTTQPLYVQRRPRPATLPPPASCPALRARGRDLSAWARDPERSRCRLGLAAYKLLISARREGAVRISRCFVFWFVGADDIGGLVCEALACLTRKQARPKRTACVAISSWCPTWRPRHAGRVRGPCSGGGVGARAASPCNAPPIS